jgi:hypothetical protein
MSRHRLKEPITPFDDPSAQLVYKLLTDDQDVPPGNQHWEGWIARRIVDVLEGRAPPPGPIERERAPQPLRLVTNEGWDD